jgi:hypothetical protein
MGWHVSRVLYAEAWRPSIYDDRCRPPPAIYPRTRAGRPRTCARPGPEGSGLLDLAPGGVCRAVLVAQVAGGLLHHRFTLTSRPPKRSEGGLFSVALSRRLPGVAVSHHPALWSPDFPRRRQRRRRGRPASPSACGVYGTRADPSEARKPAASDATVHGHGDETSQRATARDPGLDCGRVPAARLARQHLQDDRRRSARAEARRHHSQGRGMASRADRCRALRGGAWHLPGRALDSTSTAAPKAAGPTGNRICCPRQVTGPLDAAQRPGGVQPRTRWGSGPVGKPYSRPAVCAGGTPTVPPTPPGGDGDPSRRQQPECTVEVASAASAADAGRPRQRVRATGVHGRRTGRSPSDHDSRAQ